METLQKQADELRKAVHEFLELTCGPFVRWLEKLLK